MNTIQKRVDNFKAGVKNLNDEALNVSDNVVEASLATGAKLQKIMAKALNGGTELFGKQQDLALTTLEELKGQLLTGNKRFKKLIGLDLPKVKKAIKKVADPKAVVPKKLTKVAPAKTVKAKAVAAVKAVVTKDDLTTIDGIGPKVASILNQAGITTFHRLAATPVNDIKNILEKAGPIYKAMDPTSWKKQANSLINGKKVK